MKQAMIFAAGLGTRLKPLTDTMPKALVRVGDTPLLGHVIMKLKAAGYERIVINVHHFAQQIVDYIAKNHCFDLDIRISDETGGLLETGGGIRKALPLFDPRFPILIHNVDILSDLDFNELVPVHEPDALLVVSSRQTKRYLLFDDSKLWEGSPSGMYILNGWTNIETGEVRSPYPDLDPLRLRQLAFSGIHILWPQVFPLIEKMPERFGIIDFYLKYCHQCTFVGYEKKDLRMMDVGKLDTLHEAEVFLRTLG
jgi:NDP-sugar pyrophosphorylase family protein